MPTSLTTEGAAEIGTYGCALRVGQMQLRLLTAGPVPTLSALWGDYTEAAFPGYAPLVLPSVTAAWDPTWGAAVYDFGELMWTLSTTLGSPVNVRGVALYNQYVGNDLLWAWMDDDPFPQPVQAAGDQVIIHFLYFAIPP